MYESPISLEEACLNVVCHNILTYIEPQIQTKDGWTTDIEDIGSDCYDDERSDKKYKFRDPGIFLINQVSEKLMNKMMQKKLLCDATLNIFTEYNTRLKSVRIKNCKVTKCGLQILRQHKITDVEVTKLRNVNIEDVLDCLNDWSLQNLRSANFAHCPCTDMFRFNFIALVASLKSLKSLNLAFTELNQVTFKVICEDLKTLEKIDLSGTSIKDLRPLEMLSGTLVSLSLCDMVTASEHLITALKQLILLRFLDVSIFNEKLDKKVSYHVMDLLDRTDILPNLETLDISGWKELIPKNSLLSFIDSHLKLEFLGLVLTSITFDPAFCEQKSLDRFPNLRIAGLGNEDQIKLTLHYYKDRYNYVQKALYHLFQLTGSFVDARPDVFKLVLPAMEVHSSRFGVQMAATACIYNLTRLELSKHIHPQTLSRGVELTLVAMETFPDEFQLQKNSLLTLCSDRILQEVTFDRFRCAKLVLDALCGFEDFNMNRMAVAICSILASKVSTEETSELGARPVYMRKLLSMVQSRVELAVSDITLKFTLSALWNLTDESPATCSVFLDQGGSYLYLKVLQKFNGNAQIETKILGLLNNIAEVIRLREKLLTDELVCVLYDLLQSDNIDVSYFAAGIVAHLTSDGDQAWKSCKLPTYTRSDMLEALTYAVSKWKVPESEMVAYRSFKPFFPLLRVDVDYQVQFWAVWAINHVCTKNPSRYCQMLYEERGHILLGNLINFGTAHPDIRQLSQDILQTLRDQGVPV
ncbi:protein zyg-11 homolog B-like [Euwallacea similis]|uniref:protein zyg-11 homolog B-like n=1 Tax=Euwallacea similis TaxID=1736056 RepID=UPI0034504E86